jgi:hypothetical protein
LFTIRVVFTKTSPIICKKNNSNYSNNSVGAITIKRNELFRHVLNTVEEHLNKFQTLRQPQPADLLQYKLKLRKFLVSNSINARNEGIFYNLPNQSNFYSFLSVKNKKDFSTSDNPSNFFDQDYVKNISEIPLNGSAKKKPWSSTYWPTRNSLLAVRYDRSPRNTIGKWDPNKMKYIYKYTYSQSRALFSQPEEYFRIIAQGLDKQKYIDDVMSPAEKWDILFDDTSFTFTNWMRSESDKKAKNGDIPTWYGICHGWCLASYYFSAPKKPVTLPSADGKTRVTFLPDDIKALASQFWAKADFNSKFSGNMCPYENPKDIKKDPETGLYTDPNCFSIDPGAFIIILGNQMGIQKKNFSFDPDPDGQIWNQPCESYSITWYNLEDKNQYEDICDNMTSIKTLNNSNEKFLKYVYKEAPFDAEYIMGAYIQVKYTVETEPIKASYTKPDASKTVDFLAAVYLDGNYDICGGRWKYNSHPNFAWTYDENIQPKGVSDDFVTNFFGTSEEVKTISQYAKQAASKGQPLLKVLEYLVNESNK